MIVVKNWGPDGIADLANRAVRIAYRRMKRRGCDGEAERLRQWFGDEYRQDVAQLIVVGATPEAYKAPAKQVLRQLSSFVFRRHLEVEIGSRTK